MPRPKRADEANGIYHALNRGNARRTIFEKPEDYDAVERILAEGLQRYPCQILSYQLMPNHWHFVLQPLEDGAMSNFLRWVTLTHTQRYHAHYGTGGRGMSTKVGSRVSRFRMTAISSLCLAMSSETHCEAALSTGPKHGSGDLCTVGEVAPNRRQNCFPPGRSRVFPTGPVA
ncbi:transposase [Roseimaritima ulvae]|uniref:Transposase IS200 like protein n=1 Tax=Roseimaritima ulvae TaxID=980254 RepID=A0A5B9QWW1_9BACT|nr:transposase [Roseimaritima ulvae]QEG41606.1 Transposase IS200 like protein [Roseimaritima ulvae]